MKNQSTHNSTPKPKNQKRFLDDFKLFYEELPADAEIRQTVAKGRLLRRSRRM